MTIGENTGLMSPRRKETVPDESTYRGRLAAAIYARRIALGISVAELAETVGVTRNTIYEWERGDTALDWDRLPALAAALKLKPRSLIPPG